MKLSAAFVFIILPFFAAAARAEVTAPMFGANMVIQRGMAAPVFGVAAPGEAVTVAFAGQTKSAQADPQGAWRVALDPMPAGGPFTMEINSGNTLAFDNVMVGEVWFCGGQSNMGYAMKKFGERNIAEAGKANYPDMRVVTMQRGQKPVWEAMTHEVSLKSSATAYYFAKELQAKLKVPIGLIVSSSPGTSIRYWVDPATIAADPKLAAMKSVGKWYNELVRPAVGYGIRGCIWYQGESDTDPGSDAREFEARFFSLIKNYRKAWGQGDYPFIYVQIAAFGETQKSPGDPSVFAEVRDAQTRALALPGTAMAVTIDIGDKGWHPNNKEDVGHRLALPALRLVYDIEEAGEYSGPMIASCQRQGDKVSLRFSHAQGLTAKSPSDMAGFAVSGADGSWHWAKPAIENEKVVLSCAAVPAPVKVRYAWADFPVATPLYNAAGLPAVPFEANVPD